ncbi:hypothetical protein F444_10858 [Phytophthora nicotianae P1976]|uniref:SWIM-type domain-containing protein n=1 Tax=Phytophthora nicotianae P1976 TaxID=1317066 RepID=A0A081A2Q6_PHYNI|nr:hypothetical protein F444_10858 [Phytophthora nicotianae P1976]
MEPKGASEAQKQTPDDNSDADFLPDGTGESEDDEKSSVDSDEPPTQPCKGKLPATKASKVKRKPSAIGKENPICGKKRLYSPHISVEDRGRPLHSPPPKMRKTTPDPLPGDMQNSGQREDRESGMNSCKSVRPEYNPRKRSSKYLDELKSMQKDREEIVNVVPPFPSLPITSWEEFDKIFNSYKIEHNLKFRVRSSQTTVLYNSTNADQIPTEFQWVSKIFRCTHGVSQSSRSKGHRNRKIRYCGCKARFTAVVNRTDAADFTIKIFNENHTHSHPTTASEASSYLTTKTLPLDEHDREDVKTLADARVSSKHISNFLNDRIGCKITPQQTRNLIRNIMGGDSAEVRLKDMLHALRQLDDSDVLVMQDQIGMTTGIILQTKVQKLMFERWGETLAMDFTHGTNNLGYHLGSLVVTTATGRGFPVVDFICLNEQALTITKVLEYFKDKNPGWNQVQSVVIDKDFVEWGVLKVAFPGAKILLCQFHAITYWKKVMKRPVYRLRVSQCEELLVRMSKLLYSNSCARYNFHYDALRQYCKDEKREAFFAYFDKNWDSCRDMWANFARGKVFTAGNTTTNRIESNWNQVKMLLGHKTRIDKTIAGLLQHQMTITQKIAFTIGLQHSSSRIPKTVPKFLRSVATRLSADTFATVKKEWERFVNLMAGATTKRVPGSISFWKVDSGNEQFVCDAREWTCTCLFFTSHHLPCRHIMQLAECGLGFKVLPVVSIDARWSLSVALDVKGDLTAAADLLKPIVQMSKLRSSKVKLPEQDKVAERSGNSGAPRADAKTPKEVAYVRLYRKERANQVVLSSSEKYSYAKAMLEPLLEHLSCLSSAAFYQELSAWKDAVQIGLNHAESDCGRSDHNTDDGDQDGLSSLDPLDAMDTVKLMEELEDYMPVTDGCTDSGGTSELDEKISTSEPGEAISHTPKPPSRAVDIINLPQPKRRGNSRVTTKQLRQTTLTSGQPRLAVHKYPSGLTVTLDHFVRWARNTPNLKFVMETLAKYPVQLEDPYLRARTIECRWEAKRPTDYMHAFAIPVDLSRSLQAAVTTAWKDQNAPDPLTDTVKKHGVRLDIVATIDPKLWEFSRHQDLANEVIGKFASSRLLTEIRTLTGTGSTTFENILGGLCRGWLNDTHIDFCLRAIGGAVGGCYVISSLMWDFGWPSTPKIPIGQVNFVLHAVHLDDNHWGVVIIHLQTTNTSVRVHVHMYEPLISECYHKSMEKVWEGIPKDDHDSATEGKEGLRGYLDRWLTVSKPNSEIVIENVEWVLSPRQPDGSSCGVLVVAQCYNYVTGNITEQTYDVSKNDVKVMRLRIQWTILHMSKEIPISDTDAATTTETLQKLQKELG